ncbi:RICIN domain-containing protein [Flavihumibacter solisilvae]|uniref:Ricin B lectin domain-containing protein n=1 Tax=Flavihumibacter solisilvae TaxID=1349421 RepID=A0A0C1IY96_9BACT|nr:RICIN domain-containing protein [Flavihumibacter solisilvae]KIC95464.1 hypothetical protein OI18_06160 [Flavihumibacter solisilvae]
MQKSLLLLLSVSLFHLAIAQPGNTGSNTLDANPSGERSISLEPVLKLFPDHVKGDRDFKGNGPNVTATVRIRISNDQKHILGEFNCSFAETVGDWTTAVGNWTFSLYEAPPGKKIMKINSATFSQAAYVDNDHSIDNIGVSGGDLVRSFEMNGDTGGDDVGNNTDDDTYMSVHFNPVKFVLTDMPVVPAEFPHHGYQVGNKQSGMVLDVQGSIATEKNPVWQYQSNLSAAQRFTLEPAQGGYLLRSNISDLYFTVRKPEPGVSLSANAGAGQPYIFFQDKRYRAPRPIDGTTAITVSLRNQVWKLLPAGEDATWFLEPVAFPGWVLTSPGSTSGPLTLTSKGNLDVQKWVIRRPKISSEEAGYGLAPLWIDAPGVSSSFAVFLAGKLKGGDISGARVSGDNLDVNILAPAHRSVGEMIAYDKPIRSYEILEGIVGEDECQVAVVDFPTCHYTHDMTFRVKPNKRYESLLATSAAKPDHQKNIEVEWETGLGQEEYEYNPAKPFNTKGNSFGFFSEGHTRKDIIWNWPSPGDSVFIEGMWIWERGHGDPHTEIHPPHFVATKRHLPVSFSFYGNEIKVNNKPLDQFYGQRVDVFASADGSTQWNTKGLMPFAQVVEMDRKDYVFHVSAMFAKPHANAALKWRIIRQPGNSYSRDPQIELLPDGKTARVTYPWKSIGLPNTEKIAQSIIFYWDHAETKGIVAAQKPLHFEVRLNSIEIIDNEDVGSSGDCVFYANIGNNWVMLNEFTTDNANVLNYGLGDAEDNTNITSSLPAMGVYVMKGDHFRIHARGWENDHMNTQMGRILNEYSRSAREIKNFLEEIFSTGGITRGLIEDEDMSEAKVIVDQNSTYKFKAPLVSKDGEYKLYYSLSKTN